jgi:hypothetical protein
MKRVSSGLRVSLAMAFCAALLAPSALADNGKKPHEDRPGNSSNAPGHNKSDEVPPPQASAPDTPSTPAPPEGAPAPEHAAPPETTKPESTPSAVAPQPQDATPPEREGPAKPEKPQKPEPNPKPRPGASGRLSAPAKPADDSKAHQKVLICHATGSATNPYVLISVSASAWSNGHGHGAHADDVFVDWSWPGDHRQKNDALCPASSPVDLPPTTSATPTAPPATGATTPASARPGPDAPAGDAADPPAAEQKDIAPSFAPPVARAVEGDVLISSARLARTAVRGTLPFTGLPVWAVMLIGSCLLSAGLVLRCRTAPRRVRS